jgi:hypothetical protein
VKNKTDENLFLDRMMRRREFLTIKYFIMMTDEQKKFIVENVRKISLTDIAKIIGIKRSIVYQYIYRHELMKVATREKVKGFRVTGFIPDRPKEKLVRPAPVYNNSRSPYGIADEYNQELSFSNPDLSKRILL